ncbi:acyl-CoA dehydrogenase family protein [Aquibium sp. LZ166]|uniref:Acyl-CoA dehydrogenase family protein n=1 Tax=Aquibium pacificus TaxID=3153579 RepID=A0ABV3SLV0_9HYPH
MALLSFPRPPEDAFGDLRADVRAFLARELEGRSCAKRAKSWKAFDPDFSRKLGARGWIGMTWPKAYGGRERSSLERYVVQEELLAAGAPVAAHWIADRQSGPLLIKYGTEEQRLKYLPRIAAGEHYFCIGMSEPDSGSDLAATRTKAERIDGGYRVNGTKVWTSHAHEVHSMILFCRTGDAELRHGGVSQFVVDLDTPGITVRPIRDLSGDVHFNEVLFRDVFLPASCIVGTEGEGWKQVTSELAFERSGPERFLSSFPLFATLTDQLDAADDRAAIEVGKIVSRLTVLRQLSRSIAGVLDAGGEPAVEASIVKDVGTTLDQQIPEIARSLLPMDELSGTDFNEAFALTLTLAPCFSIQGGTREILRGIIARGLGLR